MAVETNDGKKIRGRLTAVSDSSFVVAKHEVAFSAVQKIKLPKGSSNERKAKGLFLYCAYALLSGIFGYAVGWLLRTYQVNHLVMWGFF